MPLKVEIVTPDGIAWHGNEVDSVVLPARSGEIEILPGHIPLITILDAGAVIVKSRGKEEGLAIDIGYARCMGDVVAVLTEAALEVSGINEKEIEAAKQNALKAIEDAKKNKLSDDEIERLEALVRFSAAQLIAKARGK